MKRCVAFVFVIFLITAWSFAAVLPEADITITTYPDNIDLNTDYDVTVEYTMNFYKTGHRGRIYLDVVDAATDTVIDSQYNDNLGLGYQGPSGSLTFTVNLAAFYNAVYFRAYIAPMEMNSWFIDEYTPYPQDGLYPYQWSGNGVTHDIYYLDSLILSDNTSGDTCYCVGITYQVFMDAYQEYMDTYSQTDIGGMSVDDMKYFRRLWYIAIGGIGAKGCVQAMIDYNIGYEITDWDEAQEGDFVQLWRHSNSGHSVIFRNWVRDTGDEIIGMEYWSTQSSTNGIGVNTEYFGDSSGMDASRTYVGRLIKPADSDDFTNSYSDDNTSAVPTTIGGVPEFDALVRAVPMNEAVYLEWTEAVSTAAPITYSIYISGTSGGQDFNAPDFFTQDLNIIADSLTNGSESYFVVRAENAYGQETGNTNEISAVPGGNMLSDISYNADFEYTGTASAREPIAGKPEAWGASSQDYGDKTSEYYLDDTDPYEGTYSALVETSGTPADPNDLSIASLTIDTSVPLLKDHTYAVSAAVRRSDSQWLRFILFSEGFSIIHTESFDALDDQTGDSGWEIKYLHFRAPADINAYVRLDSLVTNKRTADEEVCSLWLDDVQIVDMGIESISDTYNTEQCGIRNRYFDLTSETEVTTLGGVAYSSTDMPRRWNIAMAVDNTTNHAAGYPLWGQIEPSGLNNTSGPAGFVTAMAADTSLPAWPAVSADGVLIDLDLNNGQRHVLTFDYGAAGLTLPLLRTFMISPDFSHYASLFIDPVINIPGIRMWPLSLHYTPGFDDEFILTRFDNVTIGPPGTGNHTDETTMYIDNVLMNVLDQ